MAHHGSICEPEDRCMSLKRKRNNDDEDLENMPPTKVTVKPQDDVNEYARNVIIESSPSSSDDEGTQTEAHHRGNFTESKSNCSEPRSNYTEIEYDPDNFLSPPSLPELPNCVLSPLENVSRGECTPHSNKRQNKQEPVTIVRKCPLPLLSWAEPTDVWDNLCECDEKSNRTRNPNMFDNHPDLQVRMRAILLDWLNEVSEVYKLHRESYHLTVEYLDRYLASTEDLPKGRLQLLGITCLFIAAKVEEVYPPKVGEFSYVTDGACSVDEILAQELHVLSVLSWDITPITVNGWLNIYMQLSSEARSARRRLLGESDAGASALRGYAFVFPQYSSLEFVICGQLVDLAVLHVDVNRYASSVVAAAAMAHSYNKELAMRVSGYDWAALEGCYRWLAAAARGVRAGGAGVVRGAGGAGGGAAGAGLARACPALNTDAAHALQVHNVTLDMFDDVYMQMEPEAEAATSVEPEPAPEPAKHQFPPTPPQSGHKSPKTPTAETPSTRHARDTE